MIGEIVEQHQKGIQNRVEPLASPPMAAPTRKGMKPGLGAEGMPNL
jgi:hypothetical protein